MKTSLVFTVSTLSRLIRGDNMAAASVLTADEKRALSLAIKSLVEVEKLTRKISEDGYVNAADLMHFANDLFLSLTNKSRLQLMTRRQREPQQELPEDLTRSDSFDLPVNQVWKPGVMAEGTWATPNRQQQDVFEG